MRVLVITYYWPPSGGSGVQRWLKTTKYFPEFGIKPYVITPENPSFINRDPSLLDDIGSETRVIRRPIKEPYSYFSKLRGGKAHQKNVNLGSNPTLIQRLMLWVRGNLFIPDPRVTWVKPTVKFLKDYIPKEKIDLIITTGPPHSMHLIGLKLKRDLGIKWIADFRDPWSEWDMLDSFKPSKKAREKHVKLEKSVLEESDHVLSVGWIMNEDMLRLGAKKSTVVLNGFDPNDFQKGVQARKKASQKSIIRHIGSVDELRNPRPFLRAIEFLITEGKLSVDEVEMEFIGNVSPNLLQDVKSNAVWKSFVTFSDYKPHKEIIQLYQSTNLLLLVLAHTHEAKLNIPGKIYEYIASGVPVVGVGDPLGDSSRLLRESGAGEVVDPDDQSLLAETILRLLQNGKTQNSGSLENSPYSRKNLAEQIADIVKAELKH